jgi:hypothetical protein
MAIEVFKKYDRLSVDVVCCEAISILIVAMIFLTNRRYREFINGKNGIVYHNYDFCTLANEDYYIDGAPDTIDNSGLRDVSLEINNEVIQSRSLKKCSWCNKFESLSSEFQNKFLYLKKRWEENPTDENTAAYCAFVSIFL